MDGVMIYLKLGIIITKGTYIFYVKYMLRGRKWLSFY